VIRVERGLSTTGLERLAVGRRGGGQRRIAIAPGSARGGTGHPAARAVHR
jgi:hypothetical protein